MLPNRGYYNKSKTDIEVYLANANRPVRREKFSKYRGVHKSTNPKKPFRAAICFKGKRYVAGVFESEVEAAKAYNRLALHVIGKNALLNVIENDEPIANDHQNQ